VSVKKRVPTSTAWLSGSAVVPGWLLVGHSNAVAVAAAVETGLPNIELISTTPSDAEATDARIARIRLGETSPVRRTTVLGRIVMPHSSTAGQPGIDQPEG
jgi:hypothetical protein